MRIVHVGAWNRNWGDAAIQLACRVAMQGEGEWVPLDCQSTEFTASRVRELEATGQHVWLVGGGGLIWAKPELESVSGWQWQISQEAMAELHNPVVVWAVGSPVFPYGDRTWDADAPWAAPLRHSLRYLQSYASRFTVRGGLTRALLRQASRVMVPEVVPDIGWALCEYLPNIGSRPRGPVGLVWGDDKPDWRWAGQEQEVKDALVAELGDGVTVITHLTDEVTDGWPMAWGRQLVERHPAPEHVATWAVHRYRGLRAVVSVRKHGLVLGAALGVPVVALGDVGEVAEIATEIGAPVVSTKRLLSEPGVLEAAVGHAVETLGEQQERAHHAGVLTATGLRTAVQQAWKEAQGG